MFTKLLEIFIEGGWTILTPNPLTSPYVNIHSTGISGDKHMYIRLKPFDGNTGLATYDIRTTDYTDFQLDFGSAYNAATDTITAIGRTEIFNFIGARNDSLSNGYARLYSKEWFMRYWYYVDKDRLMFISQPGALFPDAIQKYATFTFLGIPEEMYLKEHLLPVYMGAVLVKTHTAMGANKARILERPAILPRENTNATTNIYAASAGIVSPNVEGVVELTDAFIGDPREGTRGKLGGFYVCPTGVNLLDGDTVELVTPTGTHTYLYKLPGILGSGFTSFPTATGILIRIS